MCSGCCFCFLFGMIYFDFKVFHTTVLWLSHTHQVINSLPVVFFFYKKTGMIHFDFEYFMGVLFRDCTIHNRIDNLVCVYVKDKLILNYVIKILNTIKYLNIILKFKHFYLVTTRLFFKLSSITPRVRLIFVFLTYF